VEVAFTVTTVHDHRTASQVPCARRRRRDGDEDDGTLETC
jgi:hypothetical protein